MWFWNLLFYLGIFGTTLMGFGLVDEIISPGEENQLGPGIAAFFLVGILPLTIGFWQRRKAKKLKIEAEKANRITSLLRLAKSSNGVLSVSEVSLNLGISIDEAKERLEEAVTKGICRVEIDENGSLDYFFHDLISK